MQISFAARNVPKTGTLVVGVLGGKVLGETARELDRSTDGALSRALKAASRFQGKSKQVLDVVAPAGLDNTRIVLFGLGQPSDIGVRALEDIGGELAARLGALGEKEAHVVVDPVEGAPVDAAEIAARVAYGARLRSYRFDKYKSREKSEDKPSLQKMTFRLGQQASAKKRYGVLENIAEGVFLTRDLVSEPANVMYPEALAHECTRLEELGVEVEILDAREMRKLGMGALLAVAQGSVREPRLVVMRWNGGRGRRTPLAVVGKGVCFDTGGISIKPAGGMADMKWDMGGAGVTIGLMKALAARKAKVNVLGVVGLVENMPSGTAYRPGDVLTSMSGQTIEVLNTDAEGRLVLADALWYAQEKYRPETIVDLATLTGAIIVTLGHKRAGLFANDDDLAAALGAAGDSVDEPVWRLPMGEEYDRDVDSDIADMKNTGDGRNASSIAAAQFLKRYIQDGTKWAHLDIAGVTWSNKDKPTVPKGGTGFGVRLLDRLVSERFES